MKKLFKNWWLLLIVGIIVYLVYSFLQPKTKETIYRVKQKDVKEELTFSGRVDADEKVILRFQTSGRLVWVGVKEGDYIKKYQGVASLDQRDVKNRLDKYLNLYAKERNNFEQGKDDYHKTWTTAPDKLVADAAKRILENNQYVLNNAVLDVEYQNFSLEYAHLWSPIEGIVTRIETPIAGVNITPANAEFEIVNPKTIYFSASADQTEIVKVKESMKGTITLDAYPDDSIEGEIQRIGFTPKADETGTVYEIKIAFHTDKNLKLGMTGDVSFIVNERKNVISIPQTLIKKDKSGSYVFLKENNQKTKKYITLGEEIDGEVIVKYGLKLGDILIETKVN